MTIALYETNPALGGAQRALIEVARGLLARRQAVCVLLGAAGPLAERLREENIPLQVLPFGTSWAATWVLRRALRRQHADLLYANSAAAATIGGLAAHTTGTRLLWRVQRATDLASSWQTRLALRWATEVLCPTAAWIPDTAAARCRVVPPGIGLRAITPHHIVRKRHEAPLIGMLAPWHPREGQQTVLTAMRLLQSGHHRARLRLAGPVISAESERFRAMMASQVQAAGLAERITVLDKPDDPLQFLADCDVIVMPGLREASGRLALEAAAIGRPVVAARVGLLPEIIADGHSGLLVEPQAPQALADALELLLASTALRMEMGRQARIRAEEAFALTPLLQAIEEAAGLPTCLPGQLTN